MLLKGRVIRVIHVLELVIAEVAGQVHSLEMVQENQIVEKVLLAEVTPGVGQNLGSFLRARVTMLNMVTQGLDMVDSLLSNEDSPSREADLTEGLLMDRLRVPP